MRALRPLMSFRAPWYTELRDHRQFTVESITEMKVAATNFILAAKRGTKLVEKKENPSFKFCLYSTVFYILFTLQLLFFASIVFFFPSNFQIKETASWKTSPKVSHNQPRTFDKMWHFPCSSLVPESGCDLFFVITTVWSITRISGSKSQITYSSSQSKQITKE